MAELSTCFKTAVDNVAGGAIELLTKQLDQIAKTLTQPLIEESKAIEDTLCGLESQADALLGTISNIAEVGEQLNSFLGNNFCPDIAALQGCLESISAQLQLQLDDLAIPQLKIRLGQINFQLADAEILSTCAANMKDAIKKAVA